MRNIIQYLIIGAVFLCAQFGQAQTNNCTTVVADGQTQGQVFFNYGSVSGAENVSLESNYTLGQLVVGEYSNTEYKGAFGFWARYLLPPAAPAVVASEGDLADRIEISWTPDPLSPKANEYKLYRDNALLAQFDNETFSYIDFNVTAGNFYEYSVVPSNALGIGSPGKALGFLNPNGVVTGRVTTESGNPVYGAIVTLEPSLGSALYFNGSSMALIEDDSDLRSSQFTVSCWVKLNGGNTSKGILDYGSDQNKNWWLHTNAAGNGVKFALGNGTGNTSVEHAFASDVNGWHFVAATFNGSSLLFYVDGNLVQTKSASLSTVGARLLVGQKPNGSNYDGLLDEVRYFNRQLSQTELNRFMNRTVSVGTNGLKGYWKMDEGVGQKSFGQAANKQTMYLCGPQWTADRPQVINAAISDESGFYEIAGINYGPGTTFTVKASKNSYFNQSLEFNGANQQYADLTDFDLPDSSSILVTVKPFDFTSHQTILSKADAAGNHLFSVNINNGNLELTMGHVPQNLGPLGMGFQHLGFTFKQSGANVEVKYYKDGTFVGTYNYSSAPTTLSGLPWKVGARANGASDHSQYFTGLVDEVAFFNALLPPTDIAACHNVGIDGSHLNLMSFFNMNEGAGTKLTDMGPAMTGNGALFGATWSNVAAVESVLPHEFNPATRLVTLNPSNTSADEVDFVDQSLIPVSGFVRFDGTACFQEGVEIYINGQPFLPSIKTDVDGKFTVDIEPGFSFSLSPKMGDHTFVPAKWDITSLNSPVAGILFRNQTKRKISGQMAGGDCRLSVIPSNAIVKVKVSTLNGCFEKEKTLMGEGHFEFEGIPPDSVTVAVTQHSNNVIYNYFQIQGGVTSDLRTENDTVDFIYYAPPQVEIAGIDSLASCGIIALQQGQSVNADLKVFQEYAPGGKCYLDTALLTIDNAVADLGQFDTLMTTGSLRHKFSAGLPNVVSPHYKTLQITAEANNQQATTTTQIFVGGIRPRESAFFTVSPEIPLFILRDPPGDGSYSTIESGTTTCTSLSFGSTDQLGGGLVEKISVGPKFDIVTGLGAAVSNEFETIATQEGSFTWTKTQTDFESTEVCLTSTEIISTSDASEVVGDQGGDVYMGAAFNMVYGGVDSIKIDPMTCVPTLSTGLIVVPDSFATTFVYSEYFIENELIPTLDAVGDTINIKNWERMIAYNDSLKKKATFIRNLSFDAGAVYEYSESTSTVTSETYTTEHAMDTETTFQLGAFVAGMGAQLGPYMTWNTNSIDEEGLVQDTTVTTTFVLQDDDPGDNFSVDVLMDEKYQTPVFKLVSGQSQCPYEPGTQPREGVEMVTDANVAVNVPMDEVAVFTLTVGNTSQSGDVQAYTLMTLQETNGNGADVRFNGQFSIEVELEPNEGKEIVMTVAPSPGKFDYEDFEIAFFSACEDERADILGIDPPEDFFKTLSFDVHFLEPCSNVDISFPMPGWVLTPADGDNLNITLVDYDETDPDLELMRVQYRRFNGDGAWINIAEIPKDSLGDVFTIQAWDTQGLQDGEYEIRAVSQCAGGQNAGISHFIKGKIERTPPEIFGTPEPADGVLSAGDEISVTFSESIRCDLLLPADVFQNNNVGLYYAQTGNLVDATVTCLDNKIKIEPSVANKFIENQILRVQVDSVEDLAGNKAGRYEWEFFVDRNPLRWIGGKLEESKFEDEEAVFQKTILNEGGNLQAYQIQGVPNWVNVYPLDGVLEPGAQQVITFEFGDDMVLGQYFDTLIMDGALGREPLQIDFRNLCHSPVWEVDAAAFNYSMNFIFQFDIEGEISEDDMDVVGAFIDEELRGKAYLEYLPALDKYVAFLTVYNHTFDTGEITFKIWDADACLLYSPVLETYDFLADELVGSPVVPDTLHTNNLLLTKIPLKPGWNWVSFNLEFPDASLDSALATLSHPQNDLMKSQAQFAEYYDSFGAWIGSLTALGNTSMYLYRADEPDTLDMIGHAIDPTMPIPLVEGWNWVGYLPQRPLPIAEALASLTPTDGDLIKNQTTFAQYVAGLGWLGNLHFLRPTDGYLLKLAAADDLSFPDGFVGGETSMDRTVEKTVRSPWEINPSDFEHTMILVGMLTAEDGTDLTSEGQVIAAFDPEGEVRGVTQATYVEPLDAWMYFLTVYANQSGEPLTFKVYEDINEGVTELSETLTFSIDHQVGSVEEPMPFVLPSATAVEDYLAQDNRLLVRPNPVGDLAEILFRSTQFGEAKITVTDALGQAISQSKVNARHGWNSLVWSAAGLPTGIYFVQVEIGSEAMVRRILVE